ncbi:MAG: excinuclease ABC subunit UvrA [Planctomycetaceae bacterium]
MSKRSTGKSVYILDEPTTGLHFADIHKLLEVLHGFVEAGNTVIVVEHNLDVIKTADWVIDLGPEGGRGGGEVVMSGRPEELAVHANSHTGRALAPLLGMKPKSAPKKSEIPARLIPLGPSANGSTNGKAKKKQTTDTEAKEITIRGARQHNLQDLDLTIPRNQMSIFCGPSGSGKTSLAMDTLYAEGQRRYVESLSSYARQFLGQMPKPRVEHIHGLSPSIAIEQKNTGHTPRSTVGTVTEIYDYLRVLFTRLGTRYCPECEIPIATQTHDQVIGQILNSAEEGRVLILAPQTVRVGQRYETLWERIKSQGYTRVRVDGTTYRIEEVPQIDRRRQHEVEIVIDRITLGKQSRTRLADSIEKAFDLGAGELHVAHVEEDREETDWEVDYYSLHLACHECGQSYEELTPQNFSFNSPLGWCEACEGIGTEQGTDLTSLIADPKKTLIEGAIAAWPVPAKNPLFNSFLKGLSKAYRIPLDVPFEKLGAQQQRVVLYGGDRWIPVGSGKGPKLKIQYKGLYPAIEEAARVSFAHRRKLLDMIGEVPCSYCGGSRLREDAAAVRFHDQTIQQICRMSLEESLKFLSQIKLNETDRKIAGDLLDEAQSRLSFLVDVGLNYLNLERGLPTLSGGEAQRIRLAGQIGRALTGVLYVLDEPTIGLHPRDNTRLLEALQKLRDLGNTLIVVEHDREVMEAADQLVDFGPGAGRNGGEIVGRGTLKQLTKQKTLTGAYLSGKEGIPVPKQRRVVDGETHDRGWLELLGVRHRNLRDVDLKIPLGTFCCITGVSGSGKSTLVEETLSRALQQRLSNSSEPAGAFDELLGVNEINKVITVDQQPLGSTPASNPATYTGVFEHIRDLFSRLPDSRVRGYRPGRFSFNRAGGRCEDCEGNGQKCIEMHFLPDVWVECETCRGKRYNQETLDVKFNGYSIADVLEMPIGQAYELFSNIPKIRSYLGTLCSIGLDYLTLGQSAPTLSGGEAQRVKLASELVRPHSGKTLYILDEPTTGLHFDDIAKLLKVLNSLVEAGNTVVVIEHNMDVIKMADWIVDLGPEAGEAGGFIVTQGTPEAVVAYADEYQTAIAGNGKPAKKTERHRSYTGELLKPVLAAAKRADIEIYDAKQESKKQEGDLDLKDIGKEEKTPWQTDGRRWHTQDRISLSGKPCRWEGEALGEVVDYLNENFSLAEPNWNHRSTVEIKGKSKENSWFLHALTADEWVLTLKFRVPKKTFEQEKLNRQLSLTSIDDLDDIPVYNRGDRIRVKNIKGPWQEVQITILKEDDVTSDSFRKFLTTAAEAFLGTVKEQAKLKPADLMPWKQLGRKWHLLRKGFPSNKRVKWPAELIDELCELCEQQKGVELEYGQKQVIAVTHKKSKQKLATIHTKRREGVDLTLFDNKGEITLGRIADLGADREIKETTGGGHTVKIRLDDPSQVRTAEFPKMLNTFMKSF